MHIITLARFYSNTFVFASIATSNSSDDIQLVWSIVAYDVLEDSNGKLHDF